MGFSVMNQLQDVLKEVQQLKDQQKQSDKELKALQQQSWASDSIIVRAATLDDWRYDSNSKPSRTNRLLWENQRSSQEELQGPREVQEELSRSDFLIVRASTLEDWAANRNFDTRNALVHGGKVQAGIKTIILFPSLEPDRVKSGKRSSKDCTVCLSNGWTSTPMSSRTCLWMC